MIYFHSISLVIHLFLLIIFITDTLSVSATIKQNIPSVTIDLTQNFPINNQHIVKAKKKADAIKKQKAEAQKKAEAQAKQESDLLKKLQNRQKSNAQSAPSSLSETDKQIIIRHLQSCWERYASTARSSVTVLFMLNTSGYAHNIIYKSGDAYYGFPLVQRALNGCQIQGISPSKLKKLSRKIEVEFTPFGIDF